MRRRNWVILSSALMILAVSLIVFHSSASGKKKSEPSTCCKRSPGQCNGETRPDGGGELIIENLSRQFISMIQVTN